MKKWLFVVGVLLCSRVVWSADVVSPLPFLRDGALISAQRAIQSARAAGVEKNQLANWQNAWMRSRRGMEARNSIADQLYLRLYQAWQENRDEEIRNVAYRYLEWTALQDNVAPNAQEREVRRLYNEQETKHVAQIMRVQVSSEPLPIAAVAPKPRRAKTETRRSTPRHVRTETELLDLAKMADDNGDMLGALRLYRRAIKKNPENKETQKKIKELEEALK